MCPSGWLVFALSLLYFQVSDVSVQDADDKVDLSVLEDVVEFDVLESGDDWISDLMEVLGRKVDTTLHHRPDSRAYHPDDDALFGSVEEAKVLLPDPL